MAKELWLRLVEYWEAGSDKKISPRMRQMTLFLQRNIDKSPTRHDLAKKTALVLNTSMRYSEKNWESVPQNF